MDGRMTIDPKCKVCGLPPDQHKRMERHMYGYAPEMEGALIGQDGHRYETDYREVWTQTSYENPQKASR